MVDINCYAVDLTNIDIEHCNLKLNQLFYLYVCKRANINSLFGRYITGLYYNTLGPTLHFFFI